MYATEANEGHFSNVRFGNVIPVFIKTERHDEINDEINYEINGKTLRYKRLMRCYSKTGELGYIDRKNKYAFRW